MAIREIRFSQTAILKLLKDIFGASSPAGSTSTTSDSRGIAQRPVDDYVILERWDSVLLELKRTHLHLFLLTGFDGIEEFSIPNKIRRISSPVIAAAVEDEDLADLLHVRDEKSANTDGGTFTVGAWRTRDLNTVKTNEISGASVASNQITLPTGTYFIRARAPAMRVGNHTAKLFDTTGTADLVIGSATRSVGSTADSMTDSVIMGQFTLSVESVLEIQHQGKATVADLGFGNGSNVGVVEVYTDVEIRKIS